ncbi:Gfo/Idh/MocA family oxidoreductase [Mesorhizobium sp. M0614]|uniref:Gfo/Idh/MocA family oxidoreductase n=1 Tax=Mesorhizobium sp. M0614 TaxID=2956970 RepID=UPI0033359558
MSPPRTARKVAFRAVDCWQSLSATNGYCPFQLTFPKREDFQTFFVARRSSKLSRGGLRVPNDSSTSTREGHPVRVAVVGLGEVAKVHLAAFSLVPKARLEAVCDSRADVVHQISNELGVSGYVDVAEMIQAGGIDLVDSYTGGNAPRYYRDSGSGGDRRVLRESP